MPFGHDDAYRSTLPRCPGCGEAMAPCPAGEAEVNLCDACGGLWVDWFDGVVHALAAEVEAQRRPSGPPVPPAGAGECPRCRRALAAEAYRFPDATPGELVADVELLRCPECAGSFVPRSSAYLLLDRSRSPRAPTWRESVLLVLQRLLSLLRPQT